MVILASEFIVVPQNGPNVFADNLTIANLDLVADMTLDNVNHTGCICDDELMTHIIKNYTNEQQDLHMHARTGLQVGTR